jgi:branched-chain amino acid transport system substrate-binding protein
MKNRRFFALLALFAVLTLVAAACSNDNGGGSSTGGASGGGGSSSGGDPCASDQFGCVKIAAGEPITIGTLQAISGDTASLGQDQVNGAMLAIDNLDGTLDGKDGQLLGHDVQLTGEDDQCSAEGGQAGATALAANEAVVAVLGTSCSSAALGVADKIFSDKGILLISSSNTNPALTSEEAHQPFYLRTAHNDKIQGAIVADFALQKLSAKTAATINDESPYADGLAAAFRDWFTANGGQIVGQEAIQSTDTDFKPLLTSLAQQKPDVLYFPDFNPACALIAEQAKDIMPDTALIGSDGCLATDFLETAGDAANGVYASSPDLSTFAGTSAYQDLIRQYKATFGQSPPSVFHAHAFDAMNILFEAIKKAAIDDGSGNLEIPRTALKDAIFATSGYQGVTGTITCTPLGDCATNVTIGIFQAPDWPVEGGNPNAKAVFSETKTLQDVTT